MTRGWQEAEKRVDERSKKSMGDLELLESLLDNHEHELRADEASAFIGMRDWLVGGSSRALSTKQRAWANQVFDRVGAGAYENLVSSGKVKPSTSGQKFGFEMMPRPLKPPGR